MDRCVTGQEDEDKCNNEDDFGSSLGIFVVVVVIGLVRCGVTIQAAAKWFGLWTNTRTSRTNIHVVVVKVVVAVTRPPEEDEEEEVVDIIRLETV
jgi:hypothetical protein